MKKFLILSLMSFVLCLKSGVFAQNVSGSLLADTTWTLANSPYIVTSSVVVGSLRTLRIQPGVIVKFNSGTSLRIDGRLIAKGTADSTITFTSNQSYPAAGDWGTIGFTGTAWDAEYDTATGNFVDNTGCIMENAVIEYGGGGTATALLKIVGSEPFINNVTVRNSASTGIYVESGKPKIRNSTINNNSSYGVYVYQYGEYLDIQSCTIRNNSSTGLYVSMAGGWVCNNTISNNLGSGVEISGGYNNVAICKNLIKQNSSYGVYVSSSGNCTVGGNLILSNEAGGVSTCGGFLLNNIIADNLSAAIYSGWGVPDIAGNVVVNNISDTYTMYLYYYDSKMFNNNLVMSNVTKNSYGTKTIYLAEYSYGQNPTFSNNNFINNTAQYILENSISSLSGTIDAKNNWWGTPYDSAIQSLIYDYMDDGVSDMVDYIPFLDQPSASAPISPPIGVRLDTSYQIYGQVPIIWEPNVESDTAGYKVYWDNDGFPFDSVVDVGGITSYTIYTTANVYVAVTAYDTGYSLANDYATTIVNENQTSGHESWYSRLNRLPSVSLLASPSFGNVPLYVYLMATAQDSDGNIVSYSWDFDGNGTFETTTVSSSISYVYETAGTYSATVKVTDNSGGQASASMDVVCNAPAYANQPPVITAAYSDVMMISPGDGARLFATAFDPDYDSMFFHWSCSTGGVFIEPGPDSPNCTWVAPSDTTGVSSHQLTCRVTDSRGAFTESYVWIYINYGAVTNQPPSGFYVYASRIYGINGGEQISLNAYAYDPDGDPLSYTWTQRASDSAVVNTGVFSSDTGTVVNWTAPVVNAADVGGRSSVYFILKCNVDDGNNHTDWREVYVEVMTRYNRVNMLPTVDLTFTPDFACAPVMVNFEAVATDADGWIKKYEWDFDGNGAYETSTEWRRMTYTYNSAGVYNARVRVTDNDDSTAVDNATINVLSPSVPPTVTLAADKTSGPVPLAVRFTATASDTDGYIMNYQWDFDGNGNYETTTVSNSASYTYLSPGTYYANVKVSDNGGATANAGVYIMPYPSSGATNSPPFIDIHSDITTVPPGGRVRVYASGHDPDGDAINYRWYCYAGYFANFSGDSTSCDWVAPLNPSGPANYELGCEGTDGKGGSAQRSIWIYMNYQSNYNCPPWVTIIPSKYQANFNEAITLSATASDPDGDPLTYEWGANNGVFNYTTAAVVNWTAPNYPTGANIFVKVRDGRGGDAWAEVFINVYSTLPPPPTVNQPPIITDVHPDMNTIAPSGKVRLFASAYDPDYDSVSYNWRSVSGAGYFTNPGPNSANCDWYAPSSLSGPPSYELICEVKDTRGGTVQKSVWIYMNYGGGNYNKPPIMSPIVSSKTYGIKANEEIYLYAFAYDQDVGDTTLTYTWRQEFTDTAYVQLGTFTPATGSSTKWKAPLIRAWQVGNKPQVFFFIECEVSDGRGGIVNKRISVEVLTGSNEPVIIATPVSGNAPLTVDFTVDADTTNIVKYEWDFDGNGTFDKTDTTTNVARNIYMKEGKYAVKVKVHHRSGGSITSQPVTITVSAGPVMGNIDTVSPGSALRVDGFDLYAFSIAFGATPQDSWWNPLADLDGDGKAIDGDDLIILAVNFGRRQR